MNTLASAAVTIPAQPGTTSQAAVSRDASVETPSPAKLSAHRFHYIDHLRTIATVQVILAHTCMTYGGTGFWFYREIGNSRSPSSVLFTLFVITSQAYLMGLFFLLAGYFTPRSYDCKGPATFLYERAIRLGVPLLLFGFVLAPLTVAMVSAATGHGFWPAIRDLWQQRNFINGPLWFTEGLLAISIGYALWRKLQFGHLQGENQRSEYNKPWKPLRVVSWKQLPGQGTWLLFVLAIVSATFLLRLVFRADQRFFGVWLGNFPAYIFLFCLGVAARRHQWMSQLNMRHARPWIILSILVWPTLAIAKSFLRTSDTIAHLLGGLHWEALLYAAWEPFVAVGIISGLLVIFRRYFNRPSNFMAWLDRRAYAVFVFHPPVVVAVCLLLRNWHTSGLLKFTVVGPVACAAAWLLADPLVRLPILRKIF